MRHEQGEASISPTTVPDFLRRSRKSGSLLLATILGAIFVAGCGQPRFDAHLRARSFDKFWRSMRSSYAYFEKYDDLKSIRAEHRAKIVAAETPYEYLHAWAALFAGLDDPHVQAANVDEFMKYWRVDPPYRFATDSLFPLDRRWWATFKSGSVPEAATGPTVSPNVFYEVLAVNDVRLDYSSTMMLLGPPGRPLKITVLDRAGREQVLWARCPLATPAVVNHRDKDDPVVTQEATPSTQKSKITSVFGGFSSYRCEKGVGYLRLPDVEGSETLRKFDSALNEFCDAPALILDLRANRGGTTDGVKQILGRFMTGVRRVADLKMPDRWIAGTRQWRTRHLRAEQRGDVFHKPLVVLISDCTLSGGEMLAAALRQECGAVLVGVPTAGAGAGTEHVRLPCGLDVSYSRYPYSALDARGIQAIGVSPDVYVPLSRRRMLDEGQAEVNRWYNESWKIAYQEAVKAAQAFGSLEESGVGGRKPGDDVRIE